MIDPAIKEWLYAREMLRRLGFTPDELFFAVSTNATRAIIGTKLVEVPKGSSVIALELRAQGLKFVWTIGFTEMLRDEIDKQYLHAVNVWHSAGEDREGTELFAGYFKSQALASATELMTALRGKGFVMPKKN